MIDADQVRWFDALGQCRCGKPATGTLRGPRNDSYGVSCKPCADKRLRKAKQERDELAAYFAAKRPGGDPTEPLPDHDVYPEER